MNCSTTTHRPSGWVLWERPKISLSIPTQADEVCERLREAHVYPRRSLGPAFFLCVCGATANVGQMHGCEALGVHRGIVGRSVADSRRGE